MVRGAKDTGDGALIPLGMLGHLAPPAAYMGAMSAPQSRQLEIAQRQMALYSRCTSMLASSMPYMQQSQVQYGALGPQIYRDTTNAFSALIDREPTDRELAEKELREYLGEDLWKMEWL